MGGRLIAVVGPSGVGKDTVMQALALADSRLGLVRRVITRPSKAGGEDFEGVTIQEFEDRAARGAFALSWAAHGLRYGIPVKVKAELAAGRTMLVNLSRNVLRDTDVKFPGLMVLSLTARPEVLAERLAARGRETAEGIARRLARRAPLPEGLNVVTLDNSGALDDTIAAAVSLIFANQPIKAAL